MGTDLCALGVAELARGYRDRSLSPVEVTRAVLDRIDALNPRLNAFLTVLADQALAAAGAAEQLLRAGVDLGPLQGVPFSVKDNIEVAGTRTTAASPQRLDAPLDAGDAPVVRSLRRAGGVLLGKTNLHEFAAGVPERDGPFGWVQNPRKLGHQAGSSSSGAGAATAAGLGVFALGTDTGGSIRLPALVCGTVGLKATYGRCSIRGIIPLSVYLDHVGPLTRTVADAAHALQAMAGHDLADPYSAAAPLDDYVGALGRGVRGLRVGVPTDAYYREAQPAILRDHEAALGALRARGLTVHELTLSRVDEVPALTQVLIQSDGSAYHERYRGREDRYAQSFRDFVLPGRDVRAPEYVAARQAMAAITAEWLRLFEQVDVLITPSSPCVGNPHGVWEVELGGQSRSYRLAVTRYTRPWNLAGFPAIVLPAGVTAEGLPTSVQLVAPPFAEARLLAVAHALEAELGLAARLPIDVNG
jgi:aspartyl-tRNA(Asn)/glutamyl-tRNA(Gln) amidotransferase subunit A